MVDQSELRGGDAWDHKIREQVRDCTLFIPIISANTVSRPEGYFRLEWAIADHRTEMIARNKALIVPVCIDKTPDRGADVPESFLRVQWTRLPGGETPPAFCERVKVLLGGALPTGSASVSAAAAPDAEPPRTRLRWVVVAVVWALVALVGGWQAWRLLTPKTGPGAAAATHAAATFSPPPHSIAVLPFVNMSGDKEQEYFSEGLTEEVLNSLARLNELQVAARTSSFSFEGQHPDIATVAHKLNVGAVLEGSVRRSGHTVRITTQLVNGVTGFHLWSQTYDRDLGDVLKLQTEIANAVASALKVTLLGDATAKIELGGTRNPEAFDAYLRATRAYSGYYESERELQAVIEGYSESIRLDPNYALAYAGRSIALASFARNWAKGSAVRDDGNKAQADARKAIALAADLAEGHLALAEFLTDSLEFTGASQEYERALALAPGNARVLGYYSLFAVQMGHAEAGLSAARRAVALDPLNPEAHSKLGTALGFARRYGEAIVAFTDAKALAPNSGFVNGWLGYAYQDNGNLQSARAACESADEDNKEICLAVAYKKLGRHADAEAMLAKLQGRRGDDDAVFYAMIYAQWGDTARALDWLDTAMRHHNAYLVYVKTNHRFDSLRKEPRFQAIEKALKFPD